MPIRVYRWTMMAPLLGADVPSLMIEETSVKEKDPLQVSDEIPIDSHEHVEPRMWIYVQPSPLNAPTVN